MVVHFYDVTQQNRFFVHLHTRMYNLHTKFLQMRAEPPQMCANQHVSMKV